MRDSRSNLAATSRRTGDHQPQSLSSRVEIKPIITAFQFVKRTPPHRSVQAAISGDKRFNNGTDSRRRTRTSTNCCPVAALVVSSRFNTLVASL
jgi:hypothetical protein